MGAKGTPKTAGSGRKKGTPNKVTQCVKDALRAALDESHPDGAKGYFKKVAIDDPKTFMGAVSKLIPNEIVGEIKTENTVRVVDLTATG